MRMCGIPLVWMLHIILCNNNYYGWPLSNYVCVVVVRLSDAWSESLCHMYTVDQKWQTYNNIIKKKNQVHSDQKVCVNFSSNINTTEDILSPDLAIIMCHLKLDV